jgi:hypothetical protein
VLVHLRLTTPADLTDQVSAVLVGREWCTNVTRQDGVCLAGDLLEADMAREKLNEILDELDGLGLGERGGIVVTTPSGTPFAAAEELERSASAGSPGPRCRSRSS